MLCASEILLRIYVIINCIKQNFDFVRHGGSVWLPSWNLRRGQFYVVTVPWLLLPVGRGNLGRQVAINNLAILPRAHAATTATFFFSFQSTYLVFFRTFPKCVYLYLNKSL